MTLQRFETLRESNIVSEFDYDTAVLNAKKSEIQLQQLAQQITDALASDSNSPNRNACCTTRRSAPVATVSSPY